MSNKNLTLLLIGILLLMAGILGFISTSDDDIRLLSMFGWVFGPILTFVGIYNLRYERSRAANKKSIEVSSTYVDGDDSRTWQILADLDRVEAMKRYPDFDIAYLRAAYTDWAEDHENANVELLKEGLEKSIVKSRILARLSNYYVWKQNEDVACNYAILSLLALKKRPDEMYLQPIMLLQQLFVVHDYHKEAQKLEEMRPRYTLGLAEQKDLAKLVQTMSNYRRMAEDARRRLSPLWK